MDPFFQEAPTLGNPFERDTHLQAVIKRFCPPNDHAALQATLSDLGSRAAGDLAAAAASAERNPPRHIPFDPWGRRIDHIETDTGWRRLQDAAAELGIIADAYERPHGAWSRWHQALKLLLYHPSSAVFSCPLAMTDGAARALELYGAGDDQHAVFKHLTSREPAHFWTSGQWMTERTGGSDVGGTQTVARPDGHGGYLLQGTKWFTSATTSEIAMTLARIEGDPAGSKGLSLFMVKLRDAKGALNHITVHRLKDKLGTKALPTAELTLEGTPATLIGGAGGGVRKIASLFNITRIYNALCAVGGMRRALLLAKDYAEKRTAFGKPIMEHPLHQTTLARLDAEASACLLLVLHTARLLGKVECGDADDGETKLLRILTPIVKLYTAKVGIAVTSEALECFGGAGYVEDTDLPRLLRDAQVLSIWEGTTNVLCLDVWRSIEREHSLQALETEFSTRYQAIQDPACRELADLFKTRFMEATAFYREGIAQNPRQIEAAMREIVLDWSRAYAGLLQVEHAQWEHAQDGGEVGLAAAKFTASPSGSGLRNHPNIAPETLRQLARR
ncbi:acyl-CoA dehydrogenase family protein [Acanthopleuribacter pedis]|uniref:Acyl-CoA dehydrogenase family protein n=1 Tax=Acanthopleuribacter pedis TaxID=442870 RepID=A0A8J7U7A5_9BACT|nr:acyl-CoA dehydrogenase family protein [Acanthopleuribacter pedis]MBO1322303.1 acyl-CoA dehydrogenase family protein [Acanthopleuribacter pedis]